jgi:hypothetical protein
MSKSVRFNLAQTQDEKGYAAPPFARVPEPAK